jgi:hypothetical protein
MKKRHAEPSGLGMWPLHRHQGEWNLQGAGDQRGQNPRPKLARVVPQEHAKTSQPKNNLREAPTGQMYRNSPIFAYIGELAIAPEIDFCADTLESSHAYLKPVVVSGIPSRPFALAARLENSLKDSPQW